MVTISFKSVSDEIFALTALHSHILDPIGAPVTEIFTRDQLPALRVMVRAAYAQVAARLLPFIAGYTVSGSPETDTGPGDGRYTPDTGPSMTIDLTASSLSNGALLTLRHYLEHLTALTVMETVCRPYAAASSTTVSSTSSAATAAGAYSASAAAILTNIEALLRAPATPLHITPTYL